MPSYACSRACARVLVYVPLSTEQVTLSFILYTVAELLTHTHTHPKHTHTLF
eukprot:COSAG06_NODE_41764_length_388_cov_0.622837_1_plen_51_part_01